MSPLICAPLASSTSAVCSSVCCLICRSVYRPVCPAVCPSIFPLSCPPVAGKVVLWWRVAGGVGGGMIGYILGFRERVFLGAWWFCS